MRMTNGTQPATSSHFKHANRHNWWATLSLNSISLRDLCAYAIGLILGYLTLN